MVGVKTVCKALAAGFVLVLAHSGAHAVDSASLEVGRGDRTNLVRAAVQWRWANQWFQSNGTHLGGYWDLTLAYWRGDKYRNVVGDRQHLAAVGITPVFRFQKDTLSGAYFEAGIGAHYLSDLYDNNGDQLSTRFQFGDHIGVGYVFQNKLDMGFKFQHFSNGGIKSPNSGVNFGVVRVSYPF